MGDIAVSLSAKRIEYLRSESTSALVCLPFLDTDEPEARDLANQILAERGFPLPAIRLLRGLAGIGLWYQVVLWEDFHLDLSDVLAGYGLIAGVLGLLAMLLSRVWGIGLLVVAAALLLLAWLGWGRFRRRLERERDAA